MAGGRLRWLAVVALVAGCDEAVPETPLAVWDVPQLPPAEYLCGFRDHGAEPDTVLSAGVWGPRGWLGQKSFLTAAEELGWTLWTLETQLQLGQSDAEHVAAVSGEHFLTRSSEGELSVFRLRAMADARELARVEKSAVGEPTGGLGPDGSFWLAYPSSLDAYASDGQHWLHKEGDYEKANAVFTEAGLSVGGGPEAPKVVSFDRTGEERAVGDASLSPFDGWLQEGRYFWTRSDEGVRVYDAEAKPRTGLLHTCAKFAALWARDDLMFCVSPGLTGTRGRAARVLRYDLKKPNTKPQVTEYHDDLLRGAMRAYPEGLLGNGMAIDLTGKHPKVELFDSSNVLDKRGALRLQESHLTQGNKTRRFGCGQSLRAWIADSGLTAIQTNDGIFAYDTEAREMVWHIPDAGPGGPTALSRDGARMSYGGALYDVTGEPKHLTTFTSKETPRTDGDAIITRREVVSAELSVYSWLEHDQYAKSVGFGVAALPSLEPMPLGTTFSQVDKVGLSPKGTGVVVDGWDRADLRAMFLFQDQELSGRIEGLDSIPLWLDEARLVGSIDGELTVFDAQGQEQSTAACTRSLLPEEVRMIDATSFFVLGKGQSTLCVVDSTKGMPQPVKEVHGSPPQDANQRLGVYISDTGTVRVTPWQP